MQFEKLQQLLAEILGVDASEIKPEKSFVKDFGADSLTLFQVLIGVEAQFGITIEEEQAGEWNTVGQLWEYLQ